LQTHGFRESGDDADRDVSGRQVGTKQPELVSGNCFFVPPVANARWWVRYEIVGSSYQSNHDDEAQEHGSLSSEVIGHGAEYWTGEHCGERKH